MRDVSGKASSVLVAHRIADLTSSASRCGGIEQTKWQTRPGLGLTIKQVHEDMSEVVHQSEKSSLLKTNRHVKQWGRVLLTPGEYVQMMTARRMVTRREKALEP